jgi:hypothetical protein
LGSRWINFRIARYFGSGDDSLLTKLTPFTNLEALIIDLTLNNAMTSAKKGGALIAGCSPAVSLANFGYH